MNIFYIRVLNKIRLHIFRISLKTIKIIITNLIIKLNFIILIEEKNTFINHINKFKSNIFPIFDLLIHI